MITCEVLHNTTLITFQCLFVTDLWFVDLELLLSTPRHQSRLQRELKIKPVEALITFQCFFVTSTSSDCSWRNVEHIWRSLFLSASPQLQRDKLTFVTMSRNINNFSYFSCKQNISSKETWKTSKFGIAYFHEVATDSPETKFSLIHGAMRLSFSLNEKIGKG